MWRQPISFIIKETLILKCWFMISYFFWFHNLKKKSYNFHIDVKLFMQYQQGQDLWRFEMSHDKIMSMQINSFLAFVRVEVHELCMFVNNMKVVDNFIYCNTLIASTFHCQILGICAIALYQGIIMHFTKVLSWHYQL